MDRLWLSRYTTATAKSFAKDRGPKGYFTHEATEWARDRVVAGDVEERADHLAKDAMLLASKPH